MTTYNMKAPDGNTYRIEGPANATEDQVRAEILRQNPTAGQKADSGNLASAVWRGFQAAEPQDVMQVRGQRTGPGILDFKITPKPQEQQPEPQNRGALTEAAEFAGTLTGGGPGAAGKAGSAAVAVGKPLLRALPGQATKGAAAMATARRALAGAEHGSETFAQVRAADEAAQAQAQAGAARAAKRKGITPQVDDAAVLFWGLLEHHVGRAIAYSAIKQALRAASANPLTRKFLTTRAAQMGAKFWDVHANLPSTDPGDQPSLLSEMKGDLQ